MRQRSLLNSIPSRARSRAQTCTQAQAQARPGVQEQRSKIAQTSQASPSTSSNPGTKTADSTRLTRLTSTKPEAVKLERPRHQSCLFSDRCREGYRANVGICLFNNEGLVFAGRTTPEVNACWQLPQGGIRGGETPLKAALRELHEETGISSAVKVAHFPTFLCYSYKKRQRVSRLQRSQPDAEKFWGQCQKWFLLRYEGSEEEVVLNHEFSTWRWMPLAAVAVQIPQLKHEVYAEMTCCFTPLICEHTDTVEPLTQQPILGEEDCTAFRQRIVATQRIACSEKQRTAMQRASAGLKRRLFGQPGRQAPLPSAPKAKPGKRRAGRAKKAAARKARKERTRGSRP